MPEFLLELFSEEIPARMQAQAARDLERLVVGALSDRGLMFESARSFAGPRRLTLSIGGLPGKQPDVKEERKGPRVNAPQAAIDGFLKSTGLTLAQCQKRADPKGDFYVATIERKGRQVGDVLAEVLPEVLAKLPWPKSMRWPRGGNTRWVRPLHHIVAVLDGEVAPFEFAGVQSGHITHGHRFLFPPNPIPVKRFEDYEKKLRAAKVIVDAAERREIIKHEATQRAFALGLELVEDDGLLEEVAGLVEWPVVLVGEIDETFMTLPPDILQTTMRANQKYFALRDPNTMKLANKFVVVAGTEAKDGGKEIVAGNERVLRARLADAKFFWDQDRKRSLESRIADLEGIVFHAKLGTQLERVKRIEALAAEIGKTIGLKEKEIEKIKRAAFLCKADLTTGVVGEFPELQGIMGRYYALADGEDKDVANAIRDHYKPLGPNDRVPIESTSVCVALADKLDGLTGFFSIGERPTGSGDPYALRRAALGFIRIVLNNEVRMSLFPVLGASVGTYIDQNNKPVLDALRAAVSPGETLHDTLRRAFYIYHSKGIEDFFRERLKVALREKGVRHDLIDAVFALGNEDDLVRLVRRVEALQAFLKTEDGDHLLTGYKRAANILKIEERKDKKEYRGVPSGSALKLDDERALADALERAKKDAAAALQKEDFAAAMKALAKLRAPVDRFFDKVTVNVEDKALRENRLKLLSQIVDTAHQVADFSKVEG
ncbi:MAG: glycine--tRNA ligase subunit beta [Alphaproteobacteria bacterium]